MKTDDHEAGEKMLGLIDLKNEKIVQVIIYSQTLAIWDYTSICSHSETLTSLLSHVLVTSAIFPTATSPRFVWKSWTFLMLLLTSSSSSWLAAAVVLGVNVLLHPFDIFVRGTLEWEQPLLHAVFSSAPTGTLHSREFACYPHIKFTAISLLYINSDLLFSTSRTS